jgi:multidrug efflux pump subunit AcrA (membrane-fusion protein)
MSDVETNLQPLLEDEDLDIGFDQLPAPPPPGRRARRWIITAIVLLLVILLVGGGVFAYLRLNSPPPVTFTQQAVASGNLSVTTSATGPILPSAEYDMSFSTSGQVSAIDVSVGERVKAGWVLATLNSVSLQDAVAQAQQAVNNAQAVYNDAVNNGLAQSTLDQDNNALLTARQQLKAAQDNLNATRLIAPASATVAAINGVVGQAAGSGGSSSSSASSGSSSSTSSSSFITLVDVSTLKIVAQVNEADIAGVKVGQPASFTVAAYPNQTFRASVTSINAVGQTSSNVVTYPVTLTVDQNSLNNAHLYPEMTATVNITTAERIGVLLVPAAALSFPSTAIQTGELGRASLRSLFAGSAPAGSGSTNSAGTTRGNRGLVLELRNGKLTPVVVTTGLSNGQFTEVISGLNAGDEVVVSQTGGNTPTSTSGSGSGSGRGGFGGGGFFRAGGGG